MRVPDLGQYFQSSHLSTVSQIKTASRGRLSHIKETAPFLRKSPISIQEHAQYREQFGGCGSCPHLPQNAELVTGGGSMVLAGTVL